jgi:hypothetical protein
MLAICRFARLKTWQEVGHAARHGRREGSVREYAHCNAFLTPENTFGSDIQGCDARNVGACLKAYISQVKANERKGASVAAELVFSASEAYFYPNGSNTVDPKRLSEWRDLTLSETRLRFGPIPAWRLDVDEHTPHVHVFLVPVSQRRGKGGTLKVEVSVRDTFGGSPSRLRELQDWYAKSVASLGIQRGQSASETGAVHHTPRQMRNALAQEVDAAKAERSLATADREAAARLLAATAERERVTAERALALLDREARVINHEREISRAASAVAILRAHAERREAELQGQEASADDRDRQLTDRERATRTAVAVLEDAKAAAAADISRRREHLAKQAAEFEARVADGESKAAAREADLVQQLETRLAAIVSLEFGAAQSLAQAAEEQARLAAISRSLAAREKNIIDREAVAAQTAMRAKSLLDAATSRASEQAAREFESVMRFVNYTRTWAFTVIKKAKPEPRASRSEAAGLANVLSNFVRMSDIERDTLFRQLGVPVSEGAQASFRPIFQRVFNQRQQKWLSGEVSSDVIAMLRTLAVQDAASPARSNAPAPGAIQSPLPAAPLRREVSTSRPLIRHDRGDR